MALKETPMDLGVGILALPHQQKNQTVWFANGSRLVGKSLPHAVGVTRPDLAKCSVTHIHTTMYLSSIRSTTKQKRLTSAQAVPGYKQAASQRCDQSRTASGKVAEEDQPVGPHIKRWSQ